MKSSTQKICVLMVVVGTLGCQSGGEASSSSPTTAADELLDRSIELHDPHRAWGRRDVQISWKTVRPDGSTRVFELAFLQPDTFTLSGPYADAQLEYRVDERGVSARVDGREELTDDERERMLLTREEGLFWRDYFGFLVGLPMCLRDPSVIVEPAVSEAEVEGRALRSIRVRFAPDVGTDIWTLYFEPMSAELVGCRFDRADPTRDGETILFDGLVSVAGMRLPRSRSWTMNADGKHLGTDELEPGR